MMTTQKRQELEWIARRALRQRQELEWIARRALLLLTGKNNDMRQTQSEEFVADFCDSMADALLELQCDYNAEHVEFVTIPKTAEYDAACEAIRDAREALQKLHRQHEKEQAHATALAHVLGHITIAGDALDGLSSTSAS